MEKCSECKISFPEGCCSIFFSSKGNTYCCALCALKIRNKIHGLNDKEFSGEMANEALNNCRKYLNKKAK